MSEERARDEAFVEIKVHAKATIDFLLSRVEKLEATMAHQRWLNNHTQSDNSKLQDDNDHLQSVLSRVASYQCLSTLPCPVDTPCIVCLARDALTGLGGGDR